MARSPRKPLYFQDQSDDESYDSDEDMEKNYHDLRRSGHGYSHTNQPSAYSSSSRETSGSHQFLLRPPPDKRRFKPYFYRIPSKVVKYMCWALLSTILIIILVLIRASYVSSRQVEMGTVDKAAPKAPPWQTFAFLKRYHGGLKTLVPKDTNVPEYPYDQEGGLRGKNASKPLPKKRPVPKSIPFEPYHTSLRDKNVFSIREIEQRYLKSTITAVFRKDILAQ
ncbi:MAG: hypothetical protein Q9214_004664 [Letrouitia sp. 1 TL-2023]